MNAEQAKYLLDSLSKLSKKMELHTTVIFQINPRGEISPELHFKHEATTVLVSRDLLEEQMKKMSTQFNKE